ncbi:MAG: hypothetical protein IPH00_01295 [Flavobacteriales bacterium]|nr:hypothetical protein [Flavobacteriales bacterium]
MHATYIVLMYGDHHRMLFGSNTDHLEEHLPTEVRFPFQFTSVVDRSAEEQGT